MAEGFLTAITALALGLGPSTAGTPAGRTGPAVLTIPTGSPARVDGSLKPGEWADADTLTIAVDSEWTIPVFLKHDGLTLYVAFTNLRQASAERYPEILLDVAGDRTVEWKQDDWWLHASYSDCQARGRIDDYGTCTRESHPGWSANNFPVKSGVVEFRVDLGAFGVRPDTSSAGPGLGIAFVAMDQKGEARVSSCWPPTAQVLVPFSWARAHLAPATRDTVAH